MEILELHSLPKDHLSWTQINMFQRCPLQFFWRYVEGRKNPPPGAIILGTSAHIALETDLKQKIDSKENIPTEQVKEIMADAWESTVEKAIDNFGEVDWEDEKPGELKDLGISALAHYHKERAVLIQPEADGVEKKFTQSFKNSPLTIEGSIDCLTDLSLIDWKNTKRKKNMDGEPAPGQLVLYSISNPKKELRVDSIVRTKKPDYQIDRWLVDDDAQKHLLKTINNISLAIRTGIFYPTRDMLGINCRMCGYADLCKKWR
jgi:CRISPR/Cas system-associated exonuclease Cas4 (RecB family)